MVVDEGGPHNYQMVHLLFRAVVSDTWELRTMLRSIALPFSSCGSRPTRRDFHPCGHNASEFIFQRLLQGVLLFGLSLLCFEARVKDTGMNSGCIRSMLDVFAFFSDLGILYSYSGAIFKEIKEELFSIILMAPDFLILN